MVGNKVGRTTSGAAGPSHTGNGPATPVARAFTENKGPLSRFLHRFFESTEDVKDLMQDTFLRAYTAERKTDVTDARGLLFTIAKHLAINEQTKRRNRRTDAVADLDQLTVYYNMDVNAASDPANRADIDERMTAAWSAINQLSPRVREVFVLRKVFGLKQREIADRLGIAESTVEKHIAKGVLEVMRLKDQDQVRGSGQQPDDA